MEDPSQSPLTAAGTLVRLGVSAVAVVAFVLGYRGYSVYLPHSDFAAGYDWSDVAYYTLQLYLLHSAPLEHASGLPITLNIARFLAPATTTLALALTARTVLNSTYYAARTRLVTGHTVVVGSGPSARLIAKDASAEGYACVVVDGATAQLGRVPDSSANAKGRDGTVWRIGGDPRDPHVLRSARVSRAREVVVLGDSTHNADVTVALRSALAESDDVPRCMIEMRSPELAAALLAHELTSDARVHMEFFDPEARAARRLLDTYFSSHGHERPVLVVGPGHLHGAVLAELHRRSEVLEQSISFRAIRPEAVASEAVQTDAGAAIVCADHDVNALRIGLEVLHLLRDHAMHVIVITRASAALGAVISGDDVAASSTPGSARLQVFNATDEGFSLASLREGFYLDIARAAHDTYVQKARERGESVAQNPSAVPWQMLDDDLKRSNLAQAYGIGDKLRAIGLAVTTPMSIPHQQFKLKPDEVERMARQEHNRWMTERTQAGWRLGPRDDEKKLHPDLVPWEELSPTSQQKDRDAVLAIPEQLRRAGLQIIRPNR